MGGYRRSASRVLLCLWVGLASALICGITSAVNLQKAPATFLGLSAEKWLALTPVIPVVLGGAIVCFGRRAEGKSGEDEHGND